MNNKYVSIAVDGFNCESLQRGLAILLYWSSATPFNYLSSFLSTSSGRVTRLSVIQLRLAITVSHSVLFLIFSSDDDFIMFSFRERARRKIRRADRESFTIKFVHLSAEGIQIVPARAIEDNPSGEDLFCLKG